ncbi:hypothetical protein J4440_04755 [Candidatus Woesearchaeota archaeon]|nr:hypothetical protein [Candidatus Woesearchaeota archaeon]
MLDTITGFVTKAVSSEVGVSWIIFLVILFLIIIFSIRHLLDIAVDLWRIPLAVIIDAVDILAYNNPYLDLLAAFGCFILFLVFSRRGHHWGKILGIVAVLEALVGVWILPDYAFITNLMPTSTILIFISVWSH